MDNVSGFIFAFNLFLLLAIPIAAITFLLISLITFFEARIKNKRKPGSVGASELAVSRVRLILSAAIAGILITVLIILYALIINYIPLM